MEMELLNHLKHPHPLILSEEKYLMHSSCEVCKDSVTGLCYCCNDCYFVIHKSCAELPLELTNHQLHPDHPRLLLLSAKERAGRDDGAICPVCKNVIMITYAFCCHECSFFLHPECALLPKELVLEYNDADSQPARKNLMFERMIGANSTCSLCKEHLSGSRFTEKDNDTATFHTQCAMLPKTVKHDGHLHELTLHVNIEKEKLYYGCYCDLCEEERDPNQWLYYCAECEVVAHLSCGLLGRVPESKGIFTSNSVYKLKNVETQVNDDDSEEYKMAVKRLVEIALETPLGELVHFSHEHPLFLYYDVWDENIECQVCGICIYGKIYACKGCKFFLHKWCAELPQEAHFGFHLEHPLTLLPTHSLACSYCRSSNNAFSFSCLECEFGVHTTCAFLSEYGEHKSHDHPLQVLYFSTYLMGGIGKIPVRFIMPQCNACLFPCKGMSLGCEECRFYLHVACSLYPPTGKAKTHMHSLNLTYNYQEDPRYDTFYCDACEKSRTPKCWVYCCPDETCNGLLSHLDCAVPNLFRTLSSEQNIKHEKDSIACWCDACEKERDPNEWIYYRPSPKLYLLNGLEAPELDRPFQRILKTEPVYAFLRGKVQEEMPKVEELQHFSHEHPLVLCNEKWNDVIRCEACGIGIYGKTCHECGYYLHKWCAQIPQQMHFKFHPEHPLIILPSHDFECRVCDIKSFGFYFSCKKCDLEVHTLCALKPEKKIESLDMVYYMPDYPNYVVESEFTVKNGSNHLCNACKFPCAGMTIECEQRGVYLHIGCAWYPRISNIEEHTHTLTLDNDLTIFVNEVDRISYRNLCDVCDKELTPDCWGYICTDEKCNLTAAHLDCAVPNLFLASSFQSIVVEQEE